MSNNGDTTRLFQVGSATVKGLGSYHKTLPHDSQFGEVIPAAFDSFVDAASGGGTPFANVPTIPNPPPPCDIAAFVNPRAGLSADRLTEHPASYNMPPAPTVLSVSTAAEMTELYWMALLRDLPIDQFPTDVTVKMAAQEIGHRFGDAVNDVSDPGRLRAGVDVPGPLGSLAPIKPQNVFRFGLPGEEVGPLVSQFFLRDIAYGTQKVDASELPYKTGRNYLFRFADWLNAQNTGLGTDGNAYPKSNEASSTYYESQRRHISTMRDLARFVNKDALHQAYFNATLILLNGGAAWTPGNPYRDPFDPALCKREAGFGTLGGPHILALVSEVATRALKVVWNQKWQVHLRLRPEAYGGLVHVQTIGVGPTKKKRPYGLPNWVAHTKAAKKVRALNLAAGEESLLLPMAFTAGSPAHPSYGAGHACVAGACVTVLKAFFQTIDNAGTPIALTTLKERAAPWAAPQPFATFVPGQNTSGQFVLKPTPSTGLTIEGELNKLATNVAMGRTMGGVHWRSDNARSLTLGEALAAQILADITTDLVEQPTFAFRTFARKSNGSPKNVRISQGRIYVDGTQLNAHPSAL